MNDFVTLSAGAERGAAPAETETLAALRTEIDGIDDLIHDLLMRRAAVVRRVAAEKTANIKGGRLRPGREAAILRRLLARHAGAFPRAAIVGIWRELLAGSVAMQGTFDVAVCAAGPTLTAMARAQYGAPAATTMLGSAIEVIGAIARGDATIGVLPLPQAGEATAWWPALLDPAYATIRIVSRLPFYRPAGATAQALVVAAFPPDPSGADRSLLALHLPPATSPPALTHALTEAGLDGADVVLRQEPHDLRALVDVAGFVSAEDPRLLSLTGRASWSARVVGAYACPILTGD